MTTTLNTLQVGTMSDYASQLSASFRAMELARPEFKVPDYTSHVRETASEVKSSGSPPQFSEVTSQEEMVSDTPMAQHCDLAAEVQNCAIELLSLQIQEDLRNG